MNDEEKKAYHKKYYEEHKDDIIKKILIARKSPKKLEMDAIKYVQKMNEGVFKRTSYKKMEEYNIIYDEEQEKYVIKK
jgi:hypothetical protein